MAVNEKLRPFGEEIPLGEELFKAFLAGVLERLVMEGQPEQEQADELVEMGLSEYLPLADGRPRS